MLVASQAPGSTAFQDFGERMQRKSGDTGPYIRRLLVKQFAFARRIVIAVVGVTVLGIGVVMIVTPGPALVFIPIGLAILSIEFAWARIWLRKLRESISSQNSKNRAARAEQHRANQRL